MADYAESRKKSLGHNRAPTPFASPRNSSSKSYYFPPTLDALNEDEEIVIVEKQEDDDLTVPSAKVSLETTNLHKRKPTPFMLLEDETEFATKGMDLDDPSSKKLGSKKSALETMEAEEEEELFKKTSSKLYDPTFSAQVNAYSFDDASDL
jgi:hypothetical protein